VQYYSSSETGGAQFYSILACKNSAEPSSSHRCQASQTPLHITLWEYKSIKWVE